MASAAPNAAAIGILASVIVRTTQKTPNIGSTSRNPRKNATTADGPRCACVNAMRIVVASGNEARNPLRLGPSQAAADVRTSTRVAAAVILSARSHRGGAPRLAAPLTAGISQCANAQLATSAPRPGSTGIGFVYVIAVVAAHAMPAS